MLDKLEETEEQYLKRIMASPDMTVSAVMEHIHEALTISTTVFPYYRSSLNALRFEVTEDALQHVKDAQGKDLYIPGFCVTSRYKCFVHPKIISFWRSHEGQQCKICGSAHGEHTKTAAVLVHEMLHPLMKHIQRGEKYPKEFFYPEIWNLAIDFEANHIIRPAFNTKIPVSGKKYTHYSALCLGEDAAYFDTYANGKFKFPADELAETYYELLLKTAKKSPNGYQPQGNYTGNCLSSGNPDGSGEDGDQQQDGNGDGDGQGQQQGQGNGSGKGQQASDDYNDRNNMSDIERELIGKKVARDAKEHAQGRGRGNMPAGLLRWADAELAPPKVDWRSILRDMVIFHSRKFDHGSRRPTYRKLSITSTIINYTTGKKVILPTYQDPKPKVSMVIDTSGSMSQDQVKAAVKEVEGVVRAIRSDVDVVDVDCQAGSIQKVKSAKNLKLGGGGGTDMRVGIDACMAARDKPNVIVVCTDCDTPWPDKPMRGTKLIVVGIGKYATQDKVPAWAKFVQVDDLDD
jgi:predicted metal-dependent peptidase